jgi:hypothetical protein
MDRQPLTDRLGDRLLAEYGGAAAAYSLRALNGNGDSVVRVRRASDNDEEDFTAEQIEAGGDGNELGELPDCSTFGHRRGNIRGTHTSSRGRDKHWNSCCCV